MPLTQRVQLRQTQKLVMTPRLTQAIKLLQLSNLDLAAYVEEEIERNPLLARVPEIETALREHDGQSSGQPSANEAVPMHLRSMNGSAGYLGWVSVGSGGGSEGHHIFESFVSAQVTLADRLREQLALAVADPVRRMIGQYLIDLVDETGYLRGDLDAAAEKLGAGLDEVEATLGVLQSFDPPGVCARDLAECLAIQLRERDRLDPAMQALLGRLDLLARRKFPALKKICGVGDEDLAGMIGEIRRLNPKPGLAFGSVALQPIAPDIFVRQAPGGSWLVELNSDTLPRVLVNQSYYAEVSAAARHDAEKNYIAECLQGATWLVRALDRRARTILKVAGEIVRQQESFFAHGVERLRPLNLKSVAAAIGMHESTVSRVTTGKYVATSRGIFELKYFFASAIPGAQGGKSHSAAAVRHRIKDLIDAESAIDVLSDDIIVERLREAGIGIARRTVAKYREGMRIPSSVQRRREKQVAAMQ